MREKQEGIYNFYRRIKYLLTELEKKMTAIFWPHKKMGSSKDTEGDIRTEICMKKPYKSTLNKTVSARHQETSRTERKTGMKSKREHCGKKEELEAFQSLMHTKWKQCWK